MKKLLIFMILLSFSFSEDNKVNLKISGMKCAYSCAGKVSEIVQKDILYSSYTGRERFKS
jgi:hypothetical protein